MEVLPMIHHDPAGSVIVAPDIPLAVVRDALGVGAWISRPADGMRCALVVSRDPAWMSRADAAGVPCANAPDDGALVEQLRAFDDGAFITTREAELLAWIVAVRDEEERNQRAHRQHVDERVAVLQARVDDLTEYAGNLNAHLQAIEATRAWRAARRLGEWKMAVLRLGRPRRGS